MQKKKTVGEINQGFFMIRSDTFVPSELAQASGLQCIQTKPLRVIKVQMQILKEFGS